MVTWNSTAINDYSLIGPALGLCDVLKESSSPPLSFRSSSSLLIETGRAAVGFDAFYLATETQKEMPL